jgi:hypothetical protein
MGHPPCAWCTDTTLECEACGWQPPDILYEVQPEKACDAAGETMALFGGEEFWAKCA